MVLAKNVLAKTGLWKFVIVYMITWYACILQLRIPHNWQ